eukprot:303578_1
MSAKSCYIVAATRTPIGKYGGDLSSLSAIELGSITVKSALKQCNLSPENIDEVYFGNVLQANLGQAPARQVAISSGIPYNVPCTTINKVCSSGMKSIELAMNSILLNKNKIVICGGMESMSNVPYYLNSNDIRIHNKSKTMGNKKLIDGMLYDGLWDIYSDQHMGNCGDICSKQYNISRNEQDKYAILSFKRAQNASNSGIFRNEITPVNVKKGKKNKLIDYDEGCLQFNENKLKKLRPAFDRKNGSVTAGNASQLSDGAACIIVCCESMLKKYNLKPLVKIMGYADGGKAPIEFTTAPAIAIPKALKNAGLSMSDLDKRDYFEINEAFSVVSLVNAKLLQIPLDRLNIYGGAVALGHPLGCSGARIVVTLINALKQNNGRYGVAGICNGGGGASAMVIQNCDNIQSKL